MILIFFVSLALLTWQICRELERREDATVKAEVAMTCCGCGGHAEDDWLVCPRCGSLLQEHCSICAEIHSRGDRFCPWCGNGEIQRIA